MTHGDKAALQQAQGKPDEPMIAAARVQPATALPWARNRYGKVVALHGHGHEADTIALRNFAIRMGGDVADAQQNDDYVFHACNAYPKLVQFVREMVPDLRIVFPDSAERALDLLHELGELEPPPAVPGDAQENAEAK